MDNPANTERKLLVLGSFFLFLAFLSLWIAPSVRAGTWISAGTLLPSICAWLAWNACVWLIHRWMNQHLPGRDPLLFPVAMLLCGWGIAILVRLSPVYAYRQILWMVASASVILLLTRMPAHLRWLYQHRYLWVSGSLAALFLTLLFGFGAQEGSPRLWLRLGGLIVQPSEIAKLLFLAFLVSIFHVHERCASSVRFRLNLAAVGLFFVYALILFLQNDFGAALLFALVIVAMLFLTSRRKRTLLAGGAFLFLAAVAGMLWNTTIRNRVATWWNPWPDASNTSYQVVQSLIAFASGGLIGRGPGLGFPRLVPVAQSDFIFSALGEEYGMIGAVGCLILILILVMRGFRIASRSPDTGGYLLAGGWSFLLGMQSMLIIGGGLRILPLTGVTLPWMSYGGSSLITNAAGLGLLLLLSSRQTPPSPDASVFMGPVRILSGGFLALLAAAAFALGWWGVIRSPILRERTDNMRRAFLEWNARRGDLYDRAGIPLAVTTGVPGEYGRSYPHPEFSALTGYHSIRYGQGGMEAALDGWLRGEDSQSEFDRWWSETVLGVPKEGLSARLTVDYRLQMQIADTLGEGPGAALVLRVRSGEILSLVSHPIYDANAVDETWQELVTDSRSPLLNRVTQGLYPPKETLLPFLAASGFIDGLRTEEGSLCDLRAEFIRGNQPDIFFQTYQRFRFTEAPSLDLPTARMADLEPIADSGTQRYLQIPFLSPLQLALAAASIYGGGVAPSPRLLHQMESPTHAWLPPTMWFHSLAMISADTADSISGLLYQSRVSSYRTAYLWPTCIGEGEEGPYWYIFVDPGRDDPLLFTVILEEKPLTRIQITAFLRMLTDFPD